MAFWHGRYSDAAAIKDRGDVAGTALTPVAQSMNDRGQIAGRRYGEGFEVRA